MESDVAKFMETLPDPCDIKVHRTMCTELLKLVDKISKLIPKIEEAQPRCSSGIKVLCSLNGTLERARSLLWHCSMSSKLYLAMTADSILSRCERYRKSLEQSLIQIQNMVPVRLAAEISRVVEDLKGARFVMDLSEKAAGIATRALFQQDASASDKAENSIVNALQVAALSLHITSPRALVMEKRSIRKLLNELNDTEQPKRKIVKSLLYLVNKYGELLKGHQTESSFPNSEKNVLYGQSLKVESRLNYGSGLDEAQPDVLGRLTPPEEFNCSISSALMHDPVIIASGETFERVWIQKWFDEGNDTCPKTKEKLNHLNLTSNTAMKELISKWCLNRDIILPDRIIRQAATDQCDISCTSIASFGSSVNDFRFQIDISNVSLGSVDSSYKSDFSNAKISDELENGSSYRCQVNGNGNEADVNLEFLSKIPFYPWNKQLKVVEDLNKLLTESDKSSYLTSENFGEPLIGFLKNARELGDIKAQRDGFQLLWAYLSKNRIETGYLLEDTYSLLSSFLNFEITKEALSIMEVLSCYENSIPKTAVSDALIIAFNILDTGNQEFKEIALKTLKNWSLDSNFHSQILSSECIPKLIPFLDDTVLSKYAIVTLKNLCDTEEARISIAETSNCIGSIVKLLEICSCEDQEHAVSILLSLCSQRVQYCHMVMNEGVIPALFSASINGNERGKASAMELLRVLRDVEYSDKNEPSEANVVVSKEGSSSSLKEKKSSSKSSGFLGLFSKPKKKK